jgi:hypothetical protein
VDPHPLNHGENDRALWQQFGDSRFCCKKFAAIASALEKLAWNLARISIANARGVSRNEMRRAFAH